MSIEQFQSAVTETFSEMAFIDVVPTDPPEETPSYSHIIHIRFNEPVDGSIALCLPGDTKRMLVENIYGDEWESLDTEKIDDCLLEILNVLAGHYLSERFGPEIKRDLSLPELLFDDEELPHGESYTACWFDAEDSIFSAFISGASTS